ncbi:hypothetical protein GOHSU_25_00380 [Gordonia hirsuta DSM 44140 = NBRC 16056]|uniref:Uncharacterized protein n=1 Tax=Gordonia hirsuta DSM 44140 = NBRC 16056 TaxID=1121927 RepID=L7LCN2_9ACTN|nr:hypothetical protein [Gordonia hirsuta]GAC57803.1 hypothetical protein GOHSU_25_00380 [Gordonia hirsuta DSM 44140 = NBRC 16056]
MCGPANCQICGKTTWAGCGQHVEMVRQSVPAAQWCGGEHAQSEIVAARSARGNIYSPLFAR